MVSSPDSFFNTVDSVKAKHSFQIRAEQDFIFFGRAFANSFLEKENHEEVSWFVQDGDCVLSGQVPLRFFTNVPIGIEFLLLNRLPDGSTPAKAGISKFKSDRYKSADLSSFLESVCYLSGTATLVRCYTENAGDFTVIGSISKDSLFSDWEKKAIHMGGGVTDFSCISCSSEKSLPSLVKKNPPAIALDVSVFSESDCAAYLKEIPKEIKRGICGPILPEDVVKFLSHPLDFIRPSFLQGNFPSVKMMVTEG